MKEKEKKEGGGREKEMIDEWKAATDRSLANTESILRSLQPSRPSKRYDQSGDDNADFSSYYMKPSTPALDSLLGATIDPSSTQALDSSEYHFRLHKASLTSEFDRFLADIKAELDARSSQVRSPRPPTPVRPPLHHPSTLAHARLGLSSQVTNKQEALRSEVREEVAERLGASRDEMEEVKARLAEERERRMKLEKQVVVADPLPFLLASPAASRVRHPPAETVVKKHPARKDGHSLSPAGSSRHAEIVSWVRMSA